MILFHLLVVLNRNISKYIKKFIFKPLIMDEDDGVICERSAAIGIGTGRVAEVCWIDGIGGGVIGGGHINIGPRLRRI